MMERIAMKYMKVVSVCVATALAIAVYLLIVRDEFHAHVFYDKSKYYVITKHGPLIDTTALLWVMEDNKWLVCYLDHEINPGIDFSMKKAGNQVIVCLNNAVFASYDTSTRKIVYSDDGDIGIPGQVIWKDDEKGYWCATVVSTGEDGVNTHASQKLTEDYWEVKCVTAIEKAIMAGRVVSLND